jgi:signal transduction histidine kinase/DNA-binding response OmpR family regulator
MNMTEVAAGEPRGWVTGGGDMGLLLQSIAWAETPLGPLANWPQSLRTTVSIGLSSRFPILIWWGPELVMIYNDALAGIIGNKHPRAMGQRGAEGWWEVWHVLGPMLTSVLEEGASTWSENQRLDIERTLQSGYLEETYFTFSYSPIRDESGGIGGVFCAVTETTAQVLGERRLRTLSTVAHRTAEATTAHEACLTAAAAIEENAADIPVAFIYLADAGGELQLASCAGVAFAGETPKLPFTRAWPLETVLRGGSPVALDEAGMRHALEAMGCQAPNRPSAGLLVPLGPAGEPFPIGVLVVGLAPLLLMNDQYRDFLVLVASHVGTGITSARTLEAARQRADALAQLDRAKTAFFSNVSHEFRTPLTLMLGPTEDALASPGQTLSGAALKTVHRNGLRMLRLVNTLLDFSRIEAGRAQAQFEQTDLAALTTDFAAAFRSTIERAGLVFEVRCDTGDAPIHVDCDMWEKIVLNLLSNAVKFTFEGSIGVQLSVADGQATLVVKDTGVGIPEAELSRVFERFHRVEGMRSRTYEGTGIGLAFVQDLVRLHGGTIGVTSQVGRGSTFTVSIPTGCAHLPQDQIVAAPRMRLPGLRDPSFVTDADGWLNTTPTQAVEPQKSAARILLVDDNTDMREYVGRLLTQHWQVETAADGLEALERVRHSLPDLVLTDVMMPNLDGFGLLRALRADPRTRSVPILMLSARAGEDSRVEGLAVGADDYLIKPFSARELIARVKTHLELGQLRRAAETERNRLHSLFEQAPAAIAVLRGPDFVYELANAPYETLVQRSDLIGRSVTEVFPEIEGQDIQAILRTVFTSGQRFFGQDVKVRMARSAGAEPEDIYFDLVYDPFRSAGGSVEGIMVLAFEVTQRVHDAREREGLYAERQELLERERAARADVEKSSRAKDEFLAMLGHELRNPLAPIVTALELLRRRGSDLAAREHAIMERQVKHLTSLVDDLLDVSAITRGKITLRCEPVELSLLVDRALEIAQPLLELRRHRVTVSVARLGLVVNADATRLVQILSNLLTNAAKYTEPEGEIEVSANAREGRVELRIQDNGIGISEDMLPLVFQLFMQERQALDRARGGLGLGLAIVENLAKMHGGSVVAQSDGRGRGSCFTLLLPALAVAVAGAENTAAEVQIQPGGSHGGCRLLIVDDNADAGDTLALLLTERGFDVRVAYDGPTALVLLETFSPCIAFLDIGLPTMNGYELARAIRRMPAIAPLHLVALTGYGQKGDVRFALDSGFDEHMVKPIDFEKLDALLERQAR